MPLSLRIALPIPCILLLIFPNLYQPYTQIFVTLFSLPMHSNPLLHILLAKSYPYLSPHPPQLINSTFQKSKTCWFQKVKYTYDSPINSLHPPYLPPQDSMLPKIFQSIAYFTPLKESIFPHKTFLSTIGIEIAT